MGLGSGIAIFFIIWWLVFYPVLTFGNRAADPAAAAGTDRGAPANARIARRALLTTLIAAVVFAAVYWLIVLSGLTLDDIPLPHAPDIDIRRDG